MPDIFDSSHLQSPATPSGSAHEVPPAALPISPDDQASAVNTNVASSSSSREERKAHSLAEVMRNVRGSSNPLGSFSTQPKNTGLDIQMQNEEVLLLMRQHPVTQIKWIVMAIFLVFLPLLFSVVPFFDFLPPRFHVVTLVGWYLVVLAFGLEAFLGWFYNIYIVTDERVIDVDFNSLLFKNISSTKLENIEDVTVTNKGYLGSVFDFGTVLIQTAGAVDQFEFNNTPHPSRVSAFINDLLEKKEDPEKTGF